MNILLAIDESAGLRVLKQLLQSDHKIAGILTPSDSTKNSGIYKLAERSHILTRPGHLARDPEFAKWMIREKVDLLISVHFKHIFCSQVIEASKTGAFNLHPGPLPQYAGLNPVSWAIFNGEKDHGVTLHWITKDIDAGPIVCCAPVKIDDTDSAFQLMSKCVEEGVKLVSQLVETASSGKQNILSVKQDPGRRRYYDARIPWGGWIDWNCPAQNIVNFFRACDFIPFESPWGSPKSYLNGQMLEILKIARSDRPLFGAPGLVGIIDDVVLVCTADHCLAIESVQVDGAKKNPLDVLREGDRLS